MFVVAIFILSLLVVWADWVAYKRYVAKCGCALCRWCTALFLIGSNLLPYIAMAMMWIADMPTMVPMMWLLTIYTVLSLSRLALYGGILLFRNNYLKWAVGTTLCTIVAWVLVVGVVRTRKDLRVKSVEIVSARLPKAFDGCRIAFFSDLHIGSLTSSVEMCRSLVGCVNSLDADLVLFGGDLINARYDELSPRLQNILGGIESRDGVVAILGNHDTGVYVRDTIALPIEENTRQLTERIASMGWRVSNDATEILARCGDTITITGIAFSRELLEHRHSASVADSLDLRPIYEGVPSDKFNITLSHMPQLWRKISTLGYGDLVLSGHVHAMQMKGRIGEWEFSPAQLMYREWSGHYTERNSHLYITDGVGSVGFHLRIGAPPEITLLTLRQAD
ncbi:MAG: metallophosphoesterase [Alistipes sp.]|nr:metallophosphoesterase [Alistipes sp.]